MATTRICGIPDCGKPVLARALCAMHYQRARAAQKKGGPPLPDKAVRECVRKPFRACAADGCERASISRGYCQKHYVRWKKRGDASDEALHPRHRHVQKWMDAHKDYRGEDCLRWPFHVGDHGRGVTTLNGSNISAPRAMCILAHGEPPTPAHQASHSCGKGHEGCVSPRHLRWATASENEADKIDHGTVRRGSSINTAKLTEADVRQIRELYDSVGRAALARRYGILPTTVWQVATRRSWAWLA